MISPSTLKSKNIQGKFPGANRDAKKPDFSSGATLTAQPGGERFTGHAQQVQYETVLRRVEEAQSILLGLEKDDARFTPVLNNAIALGDSLRLWVKQEPQRIG